MTGDIKKASARNEATKTSAVSAGLARNRRETVGVLSGDVRTSNFDPVKYRIPFSSKVALVNVADGTFRTAA
jgi:hypothetical protein